jgi:hypothetical protein
LPPSAPPADVLVKARESAAACRFEDAAAWVRSPDFIEKSGKERSLALLMLAEAAAAFLGDLEEKLREAPAEISVELRDKTKLGPITGARSGGLRVGGGAGGSRDLAWAEISPDSLIDLHRLLVKEETSELERLRRHEQAIAFDLLAGNPGRAKEAADVLAARYPAFKRRWDQLRPGLD